MAREVRLWEWLQTGLKYEPRVHMRRVENRVGDGDPDVDGCFDGRYFELELKGCDRPKLGGKLDFEVRQSQLIWHRKRWRVGGNCWIYVRVGRDRSILRYLVPGMYAPEMREGVDEQRLAELSAINPTHTPMQLIERATVTADLRKVTANKHPAE